jgi:uncharacterized protein DUF5330
MFFLLRMAFWLGVVCVLLPGSGAKSPDAQIDATQAMTLAGAAVSDARGFCERQPDACKVGGKVAVALGHKAEAGARTIYDFVTTKLNEPSASKTPAAKPEAKVVPISNVDHGTLTQQDLTTPWHGRVPLPPRRAERSGRPAV